MGSLSTRIEQIGALRAGRGLARLLQEACRILENPLLIFNIEYQLVASGGTQATGDPIWNEIITQGALSGETVEFFKNESFIDDLANASAIAFLHSDSLVHDRFIGRVFSKEGITVAHLMMPESERPFRAYDSALFEAVCAVVSREIADSAFYQSYARQYLDGLVAKLIEGEIHDRELYAGHMANICGDMGGTLYLGVADIPAGETDPARLSHLRSLLRQTQPAFKYSLYKNHLVMLMNAEHDGLDVKRDLSRLQKLCKQKHIRVGISGGFDNIYELATYYGQAVHVLCMGREQPHLGWIVFHDDTETGEALRYARGVTAGWLCDPLRRGKSVV